MHALCPCDHRRNHCRGRHKPRDLFTHFESKLGLALAIYEELVPEVHALFDRLVAVCAEISQPDLVSAADAEAYLEVVAEELRAFLADA